MRVQNQLLASLCSLFSLAQSQFFQPVVNGTAPNQYGLMGPQNVMLYLNAFHFISGFPDRYLQATHHCVFANDDFLQCAIYVPETSPARLAGIEYIVTEDRFKTFDMEERQLWHSHRYEVTSGLLVEPGTPQVVDDAAMKILVNSYGKTAHTWRWDQKNNSYPLGIPEFVNGFIGTGQLPQDMIDARDEYWNCNTSEIAAHRVSAVGAGDDVVEGADSWKYGYNLTYALVNQTSTTNFSSTSSSSSSGTAATSSSSGSSKFKV